jgi:Tol biopolymer transport system component
LAWVEIRDECYPDKYSKDEYLRSGGTIHYFDLVTKESSTLLDSPICFRNFAFSPTGDKIVYSVVNEDDTRSLFIIGIETLDIQEINLGEVTSYGIDDLTWSPNGAYITFSSDEDPRDNYRSSNMYLFNLLEQELEDMFRHVILFPDGYKILTYWRFSLSVESLDGSFSRELISLPFGGARNISPRTPPSISPDGELIAFSSSMEGGVYQIFTVDLEGNINQLTDTYLQSYSPVWSSNGKQIVFIESETGVGATVKLMDRDGSNVIKISDYYWNEIRWQPVINK